ncbi:hypothetical protein DV711_07960 [Motiliproteus coralliicola]|uniref:Uncharacterized protein n=1 Tax=Motiliproteus coralliicola TaxID=2283196 RepID=A0A369WM23_9GAMM|nr:hypothetical protein [Motiliproteus coralliicola]RDE22521.1 hypothetical protein DV711_07960 [Motiliproteus coralliicola]
MTREEDFSDIPELGPAGDSLDKPSIPTLDKTASSSRQQAPVEAASAPANRGDSRLMSWLVLMLILVIGAGGYWGLEHFNRLQRELILANQRLTELEGLINTTDQNASKSGAAIQGQMKKFLFDGEKRIKHVDSELAKLWTVSYQRNKPKIAEVDQAVAELDKTLKALQASSSELEKSIQSLDKGAAELDKQSKVLTQQGQQQAKLIDQSRSEMQQELAQLQQQREQDQQLIRGLESQLQLRDQANQELDALQDTQLTSMEQQLATLQNNPKVPQSVSATLKDQQRAIAAINSFRKQVNSQLVRLGKQIDSLQRAQAPQQ